MNKEEILKNDPVLYIVISTGGAGTINRIKRLMDEYAKQQAMAFANYVMNDYKMSLHSESPILTDYEIYNQFIEQQNK